MTQHVEVDRLVLKNAAHGTHVWGTKASLGGPENYLLWELREPECRDGQAM